MVIVAERALPARGGLARATARLASLAAAAGERASVVTLSKDAPPGGRGHTMRDGVAYHLVGHLQDREASITALYHHALDIARDGAADLIVGMYATAPGHVAVLVAQSLGVASVVAIRGNDLDRGLFRPADLPFLQAAMAGASQVTAVSRDHAVRASRIFGREVVHVTNSVDAGAFYDVGHDNSLRAALGIDDSGAVLGFSGELREKKGMRFLLPAFAALLQRRKAWLLLLGGVRHDAEEALAAFSQAAPEAFARVRTVPYDADPRHLSRVLSLCDVMVFPSIVEGTPNAVLEAMACARPVLCTAVGGHLDLIEHGVTGALLPLAKLDRLPAAMDEMLSLDDKTRSDMGRRARDFVVTHHTAAAEWERWAKVFQAARAARVLRDAFVDATHPRSAVWRMSQR